MLLADEPTGQLDSVTGTAVMELIARLVRETGLAVLVATHDQRIAAAADRQIALRDGAIVAQAPSVG